MAIDPRTLLVFQAIARCGSLSEAASTLNMTQPAVTKALKRLEAQIGVKLFERHARGVSLTPAGSVVLPYAELLGSELRALDERFMASRGMGRTTLRLGVLGAIAASILPAAISRLLALAPEISVKVVEGIDDVLLAALLANEIDLAITGRGEMSGDVRIAHEDEFGDVLSIVASRNHPLASRATVELADTLDYPWVLPPSHVAPVVELRRRFLEAGLPPPEAKIETRSTSVIHALVACTDFLSWQPSALVSGAIGDKHIMRLPIESVNLRRQFFVLRRKGVLAPAARIFLESLVSLRRS